MSTRREGWYPFFAILASILVVFVLVLLQLRAKYSYGDLLQAKPAMERVTLICCVGNTSPKVYLCRLRDGSERHFTEDELTKWGQ
jgi:hypothetical protein